MSDYLTAKDIFKKLFERIQNIHLSNFQPTTLFLFKTTCGFSAIYQNAKKLMAKHPPKIGIITTFINYNRFHNINY